MNSAVNIYVEDPDQAADTRTVISNETPWRGSEYPNANFDYDIDWKRRVYLAPLLTIREGGVTTNGGESKA